MRFVLLAASLVPIVSPTDALPNATGVAPARSDSIEVSIERAVSGFVRQHEVDGLALSVGIGPDLLVSRGWGASQEERGAPATDTTPFRAGASLPTFVTAALLALAEDDVVDLEAPVSAYLPDVLPETGVTVRHVLTHTSGLPCWAQSDRSWNDDGSFDTEAVLAWLAETPPDTTPGECFHASATDDLLAGLVLEAVTDTTVADHLQTQVFEPLEMEATTFCRTGPTLRSDAWAFVETGWTEAERGSGPQAFGAEELCTSSLDLTRFVRGMVDGDLFGARTLQRMSTAGTVDDPSGPSFGYGVYLANIGDQEGWAWGGAMAGGRIHVASYPSRELSIAIVSSATTAPLPQLEREVARLVMDLPTERVRAVELPEGAIDRYGGAYAMGCFHIWIMEGEDGLVCRPPFGDTIPLSYLGDDEFVATNDPEVSVTFKVLNDTVHSLILDDHGVRTEAKRL